MAFKTIGLGELTYERKIYIYIERERETERQRQRERGGRGGREPGREGGEEWRVPKSKP